MLFTRESGIYPYLNVTKMPLWVLWAGAVIATGLLRSSVPERPLDTEHDSTAFQADCRTGSVRRR